MVVSFLEYLASSALWLRLLLCFSRDDKLEIWRYYNKSIYLHGWSLVILIYIIIVLFDVLWFFIVQKCFHIHIKLIHVDFLPRFYYNLINIMFLWSLQGLIFGASMNQMSIVVDRNNSIKDLILNVSICALKYFLPMSDNELTLISNLNNTYKFTSIRMLFKIMICS